MAATFFEHRDALAKQLYDDSHQGFQSTLEADQLWSVDGARRLVAGAGAEGEALLERWRGQFETKFGLAVAALAAYPEVFGEFSRILTPNSPPRLSNWLIFQSAKTSSRDASPSLLRACERCRALQEELDDLMSKHIGTSEYYSERVQSKLRRLFAELHGDAPVVGRSFKHTHG